MGHPRFWGTMGRADASHYPLMRGGAAHEWGTRFVPEVGSADASHNPPYARCCCAQDGAPAFLPDVGHPDLGDGGVERALDYVAEAGEADEGVGEEPAGGDGEGAHYSEF